MVKVSSVINSLYLILYNAIDMPIELSIITISSTNNFPIQISVFIRLSTCRIESI